MRFYPQYKLASHKELSDYLNDKQIIPINIEISPSGICDAKCPWCFYGKKQSHKFIDTSVLLKLLNEAYDIGVKCVTWTGGGEPTLHPDFVNISKENKMHQGLITNALKIPKYDPKNFEWIRVSKTEQDWNIESLKLLRQCKTLGICINYMGDEKEIETSLKIVYDLNLDYLQVRPALNTNGNKTNIQSPSIQDDKLIVSEYKFEESNKDRIYNECEGFHFVPFIWESGNLDVCGYQKENKNYNIGNIYSDTFKELLLKFPKCVKVNKECQVCCKNHEINTMINIMKSLNDKDFV